MPSTIQAVLYPLSMTRGWMTARAINSPFVPARPVRDSVAGGNRVAAPSAAMLIIFQVQIKGATREAKQRHQRGACHCDGLSPDGCGPEAFAMGCRTPLVPPPRQPDIDAANRQIGKPYAQQAIGDFNRFAAEPAEMQKP